MDIKESALVDLFNDPTPGNALKAAVNIGIIFSGPVRGIIMAAADLSGVSQQVYGKVNEISGVR